jgi:hypothetical protein
MSKTDASDSGLQVQEIGQSAETDFGDLQSQYGLVTIQIILAQTSTGALTKMKEILAPDQSTYTDRT